MGDFLYLLLLLILLFGFFLNLGLVFLLIGILLLFLVLFIVTLGNFLILGFFNEKLNWEANEFRVLLNEILKATLLEEFELVFLKVQDDLGTAGKAFTVVGNNIEGTTGV